MDRPNKHSTEEKTKDPKKCNSVNESVMSPIPLNSKSEMSSMNNRTKVSQPAILLNAVWSSVITDRLLSCHIRQGESKMKHHSSLQALTENIHLKTNTKSEVLCHYL